MKIRRRKTGRLTVRRGAESMDFGRKTGEGRERERASFVNIRFIGERI